MAETKMAEIKTIYKGESVTILFTFPEAYDMARLASHKVFVGETEFTGVIEGQAIKMQLKSSDTDRMIGTHRIVCLIDDTTLGLRKPYCGELVVAKTQASSSTTSVSNIYDIIIPLVISETAVTVGDVLYNYMKGGKGDPFLYSDFTPEQIAELQQPATDAIASIQEVELAVETAEGLRVTAEQARQTNTATAIQNAETATTNAGNAAILANEKAGLADQKATLADQKATLANDAATQANTARDGANTAATTANNAATNISSTVINNEQVQAETYNVLNARIMALEEIIRNMAFGTAIINKVDVVNEFNIHGVTNLILKGTTAPSITPDFIGQTYINTTAGTTYTAKGITNSGDWKQTSN